MIVALHSVLRPGMINEYEQRHRRIPDPLVQTFARIGIRQWRIWRSDHELFHLVDCEDWEVANAVLDTDPANAQWQEWIGVCVDHFAQPGGPGAAGMALPSVWNLADQIDA